MNACESVVYGFAIRDHALPFQCRTVPSEPTAHASLGEYAQTPQSHAPVPLAKLSRAFAVPVRDRAAVSNSPHVRSGRYPSRT